MLFTKLDYYEKLQTLGLFFLEENTFQYKKFESRELKIVKISLFGHFDGWITFERCGSLQTSVLFLLQHVQQAILYWLDFNSFETDSINMREERVWETKENFVERQNVACDMKKCFAASNMMHVVSFETWRDVKNTRNTRRELTQYFAKSRRDWTRKEDFVFDFVALQTHIYRFVFVVEKLDFSDIMN